MKEAINKMIKKLCLFLGIVFLPVCMLSAQSEVSERGAQIIAASPDSLQISILTCAPGPEVYALWGHMAIRYQNRNNGDDYVFNYGTFDMNAPFFLPKFTLGLLDYELGCQPFEYFHRHYSLDGCNITMQILNLTPQEKLKFLEALMINYLPENRGYRYNFIFDNCATRPRDILEKCVNGEIVYAPDSVKTTYRKMLHEYDGKWPWSKFGVDLVLGAKTDCEVNAREQEWVPDYLQRHFEKAKIQNPDGQLRSLISQTLVIPAERPMDTSAEFPLSPMQCSLILLGIGILVSICEFVKKKVIWGWDLLVFLPQGLAGIIIFILVFFSAHPCTGYNALIILFNPIPLFFLRRIIKRGQRGLKDRYHQVYGFLLVLFVIFFRLIPQDIPFAVVPLVLVLLLRHLSHYWLCNK